MQTASLIPRTTLGLKHGPTGELPDALPAPCAKHGSCSTTGPSDSELARSAEAGLLRRMFSMAMLTHCLL
jgi:hypothetical protein